MQKRTQSPTKKLKVAILGGSFDPPTISHLQVASETINILGYDEVWMIPCGRRPDKLHISPPEIRLKMVQLAVKEGFPAGFPVKVDPIEVENGNSIPTVHLIDKLEEMYPGTHEFAFIMGSDLIANLHYWDDGQRLINDVRCIVFLRKGYPNDQLLEHQSFPKNKPLLVDEEDSLIGVISSTEVRKRVQKFFNVQPSLGIALLVTNSVLKFIQDNKLYQASSKSVDLVVPDMRKKFSNNQSPAPALRNINSPATVNIVRLKVTRRDARSVGDYNTPQLLNYKHAAEINIAKTQSLPPKRGDDLEVQKATNKKNNKDTKPVELQVPNLESKKSAQPTRDQRSLEKKPRY